MTGGPTDDDRARTWYPAAQVPAPSPPPAEESLGVPPHGYPSGPPGWAPNAGFGGGVWAAPGPVLPGLLASWGRRVAAMLVDSTIIGLPLNVALVHYYLTASWEVDASGVLREVPTTVGVVALVVSFVWFFGAWIWSRLVRQGRTGRSWGKSLLGLRTVVERTGAPTGVWLGFGREMAHHLDGVAYVGYLWPLWDAKRQTFADKICSTVVLPRLSTPPGTPVGRVPGVR